MWDIGEGDAGGEWAQIVAERGIQRKICIFVPSEIATLLEW